MSQSGVVPAPYMSTRDQVGHELVKTEQFVVPVGTAVNVSGLEFGNGDCRFTERQDVILRQVFNAIEEITENTVNDTDVARVAEFKRMTFDVRGFSKVAGNERQDRALALNCASAVKSHLTGDGTPAWRLTAKGFVAAKRLKGGEVSTAALTIDFLRTR